MNDPTFDPPAAILERFLQRFWADHDTGTVLGLAEYLRLFPGADLAIAREYLAVQCDDSLPARSQVPGSPATASTPDETRIAHYRVITELGRGGQGSVMLCEDTRLGRRVALKILDGRRLTNDALARFLRESAVVARLDHPNICTVFDAGIDGGTPYIAMRYVEGETLMRLLCGPGDVPSTIRVPSPNASRDDDELRAGPPQLQPYRPPRARPEFDRILTIIEKLARALHVAHEAGVVHRDVKPGNVMVTTEDEPVLLDFGLAATIDAEQATLTRMGDTVGTPAYMSPERLQGGSSRLDRRTDVYSLGVTLFEALTHRRPFEAPTIESLTRLIVDADLPDPRTLNPAIGADLAVVIATALERDLGRRYQTALEFAEELRRVRQFEPIHARPAGAWLRLKRLAQRHPGIAIAAAVTFLSISVSLVVSLAALADANRARDAEREGRAEAQRERNAKGAALAEYERLADVKRLQSLIAEADSLFPAVPATAPAIRKWLARADDLAAARPRHEAALWALRARAPHADPAQNRWRFDDDADQFRHDTLEALVRELGEFLADGPAKGLAARMKARLEFAEAIETRSLVDARAAWTSAINAIGDRDRHPAYGGLHIEPQLGLVPIGADPASGLWEFAHLQSGTAPARGSDGRLSITPECGIVLVLIPGGTFTMGAVRERRAESGNDAAVDPSSRANERPVNVVRLDPYFIGKYEVTQAQWTRAAGNNPSNFASGTRAGDEAITDLNPVEQVTWSACERFLGEMALSLPTEAQWEFAARGGRQSPWWFGDKAEALKLTGNVADAVAKAHGGPEYLVFEAWEDGHACHAAVGSFAPNPFGLHDTCGNILEWCRDWYAPYDQPVTAGAGERRALNPTMRVVRGGSFLSVASLSRSAWRDAYEPEVRTHFLGLRAARAVTRTSSGR